MGASDISGEDQHDRTETSCSIAVLFKTRSLSNMCFADKPRRLCPACSGDGSTGKSPSTFLVNQTPEGVEVFYYGVRDATRVEWRQQQPPVKVSHRISVSLDKI
jgi:hypothetical protein